MYNKKLKHKYLTAQSQKEDVDHLALEADDFSSNNEWVANSNDDNEDDEDQLYEEPQACRSKKGRKKRASRKGLCLFLEKFMKTNTKSNSYLKSLN